LSGPRLARTGQSLPHGIVPEFRLSAAFAILLPPHRDRRPKDIGRDWQWLYTRGYSLQATAEFALQWMIQRAADRPRPANCDPGPDPDESSEDPQSMTLIRRAANRIEVVTKWEVVPPDGITFEDAVYRSGKLQLLSEERYRFMGAKTGGCIVEVVVSRKPVSLASRIGLALVPNMSIRPVKKESALFDKIDSDYRSAYH
jgi:hypothetical protein